MFSDKQFVLNLAPNGVIPTKAMTPHVPVTPDEVVTDLASCMEQGGVTYIHLHARDEHEENSSDPDCFRRFIAPIRERLPELPLCVSCSGRLDPSFETRSQVLFLEDDLKPDMASLTLSSLNFSRTASINEPETIVRLAETMKEQGIKPELEVFDLGMANFANYLISKGILEPPYYFNIILGNIASAQAKLSHLKVILEELPEEAYWSVGGIGQQQEIATQLALENGGGTRIGVEDNIWANRERTCLATNAGLVGNIHQLAEEKGLAMVSSAEFAEAFGLPAYCHSSATEKMKHVMAY